MAIDREGAQTLGETYAHELLNGAGEDRTEDARPQLLADDAMRPLLRRVRGLSRVYTWLNCRTAKVTERSTLAQDRATTARQALEHAERVLAAADRGLDEGPDAAPDGDDGPPPVPATAGAPAPTEGTEPEAASRVRRMRRGLRTAFGLRSAAAPTELRPGWRSTGRWLTSPGKRLTAVLLVLVGLDRAVGVPFWQAAGFPPQEAKLAATLFGVAMGFTAVVVGVVLSATALAASDRAEVPERRFWRTARLAGVGLVAFVVAAVLMMGHERNVNYAASQQQNDAAQQATQGTAQRGTTAGAGDDDPTDVSTASPGSAADGDGDTTVAQRSLWYIALINVVVFLAGVTLEIVASRHDRWHERRAVMLKARRASRSAERQATARRLRQALHEGFLDLVWRLAWTVAVQARNEVRTTFLLVGAACERRLEGRLRVRLRLPEPPEPSELLAPYFAPQQLVSGPSVRFARPGGPEPATDEPGAPAGESPPEDRRHAGATSGGPGPDAGWTPPASAGPPPREDERAEDEVRADAGASTTDAGPVRDDGPPLRLVEHDDLDDLRPAGAPGPPTSAPRGHAEDDGDLHPVDELLRDAERTRSATATIVRQPDLDADADADADADLRPGEEPPASADRADRVPPPSWH